MLALGAQLGGGIFLLVHGRAFEEATPLTLYRYWVHYGHEPSVRRWIQVCGTGSAAVVLLPWLLLFLPRQRSLFGDARFARPGEIRRVGLLGDRGILVGRHGRRFLVFGGAQHVLMSAPTRSGKGVGIVIPNLLTWPDSVVVLDVKQENHAITSAYRSHHGQWCFLFNPAAADFRTHRYNPLAYLSDNPSFRIDDIQKIANMLFPDVPGTDVIWTATPRALFLGIVLYLVESPGKLVTLGQVLRESLADGDGSRYFADLIQIRAMGERIRDATRSMASLQALQDVQAVLAHKANAVEHHPRLAEMAVWAHLSPDYRQSLSERLARLRESHPQTPDLLALLDGMAFDRAAAEVGKALSSACVRALNAYVSISSENTRAGVMTSFRSRLELWNNPLVDAATSANDFDLRELRRRRMSIYLGVTPDNLDRMAPLLNLFFQQLIDLNTRELPELNPALRYQCLLVADEFTAMGRIQVLSKGIGYIAGYGLRMLPIIQSPAQLVEVYGRDAAQTFTTNHALQVVFPPKASELQAARDISEWLGYQTVKGVSESRGKNLLSRRERSENLSDQRRALLLPQEITSLGRDRQLVVVEDCPPILAQKIRYYADAVFMDRLKSVSCSLRALGRKMPTEAQLREAIKAGQLSASVPRIDLDAHQERVASACRGLGGCSPPGSLSRSAGREFRPSDVPELAKLSLSHFALDFSHITPPAPGVLDVKALNAYADELCRRAGIRVDEEGDTQ